jgi:death-on-curing protein
MRHLTLGEAVELHRRLLLASGGAAGIRDIRLLESALAQPGATFVPTSTRRLSTRPLP